MASTGTPEVEHTRVLIVMSRFVGVGYLAYLLVSIPEFGQPPGLVAAWFTPVGGLIRTSRTR